MSEVVSCPSSEMSLNEAIQMGLDACQNNAPEKGLRIFQEILTVAPNEHAIQHVCAQLLLELGKPEQAFSYLENARALVPERLDYLFTEAQLALETGQLNRAEAALLQLQQSRPDDSQIIELLIELYQKRGDKLRVRNLKKSLKSALISASQIDIEIEKNLNVASHLIDQKCYEQAEILLQGIISLRPKHSKARWLLGNLYQYIKQLEKSRYQYETARNQLDHPNLVRDYGRCLLDAGELDLAKAQLTTGLKLFPDNQDLLLLLAELNFKRRNWSAAAAAMKRVNSSGPQAAKAAMWKTLAASRLFLEESTYLTQEKFSALEQALKVTVENNPSDPILRAELGSLLQLAGRYEEAFELQQLQAESLAPSDEWYLHIYYRALRDIPGFLSCYEKGHMHRLSKRWASVVSKHQWCAESFVGKKILMVGEQGVGDEILHAHNFSWISERAESVKVYCDPRLLSSFKRLFPNVQFLGTKKTRKDERIYPGAKALIDEADYVIPSADLMAPVYRETGALLIERGYFKPLKERSEYWKNRLDSLGSQLKVGISWGSGRHNASRSVHYLSQKEIGDVMQSIPGATFINLQYDVRGSKLNWLKRNTDGVLVDFDALDLKDDFEDTAALMSQLDLVISPLTAVWELAEAVGVPTMSFYGDFFQSDQKIRKQNFWFPESSQISLPPFPGDKRDEAIAAISQEVNNLLRTS